MHHFAWVCHLPYIDIVIYDYDSIRWLSTVLPYYCWAFFSALLIEFYLICFTIFLTKKTHYQSKRKCINLHHDNNALATCVWHLHLSGLIFFLYGQGHWVWSLLRWVLGQNYKRSGCSQQQFKFISIVIKLVLMELWTLGSRTWGKWWIIT